MRDHAQVTVRSCHPAGKDWLAGRLALWWACSCRGLAVLTGPTAAQIREILMRCEVRTAFHKAGLPGELHVWALRPVGGGMAGILVRTGAGVSSMQGLQPSLRARLGRSPDRADAHATALFKPADFPGGRAGVITCSCLPPLPFSR